MTLLRNAGAMLLLSGLAAPVAHADPPARPPDCAVSLGQIFCFRTTQFRKLASDPQGDAWEVMFEFLNWTDKDVVGIDVALNTGSLTNVQGRSPFLRGGYIDENGRPFGPGTSPPLGNLPVHNDWYVPIQRETRIVYSMRAPGQPDGTPIPHPMVQGTIGGVPATFDGLYDPDFANSTLPECSTALTQMIPGSSLSGSQIVTSGLTLDDGDNVRGGFVIIVDDFDPGETLSLNWVLLVGDGTELGGYVDPTGTVQGDPMGFGIFSVSLMPNGLPAEPIFNENTGFDPINAFDPNQDSEYLWAEDEDPLTGIDQYPVNPVPGGMPGQGTYMGIELGASVTGPFVEQDDADGDGTFTFNGSPISMDDNVQTTGTVPDPFEIAVEPLIPGTMITLRARGAVPGDSVWFIRGQAEGPGPCPPVLLGDCSNLIDAVAFGETTADANGEAQLLVTLPAFLPIGASTLFQAVAIRRSAADGFNIGDNYSTEAVPVAVVAP